MAAPSLTLLERRAQRVLLWRELVASLQKNQRAIVLSDLRNMEKQLAQQLDLCRALVALGDVAAEQPSIQGSPGDRMRWEVLNHDLLELERRGRHLGRVQESLLCRSRRAQELMTRLLATTALTYTPPPVPTLAAGK